MEVRSAVEQWRPSDLRPRTRRNANHAVSTVKSQDYCQEPGLVLIHEAEKEQQDERHVQLIAALQAISATRSGNE
eukprot:763474-Hanusia_phi.AAC.6